MSHKLNYFEDLESNIQITALNHISHRFVDAIKPSFLTRNRGPRKQVGPTAYLDGLRGFAAFLVYWQHHQLWPRSEPRDGTWVNNILENAFGYEGRFYFACLPGIRTFFTGGHFSVAVFFIISGYVLSNKPLKLIYAGEFNKLGDNLASAFFRRWIRLFLPVLIITFMYMSSWHIFDIWVLAPERMSSYREELWNWYVEMKNFSFMFRTGGNGWTSYGFHTWSIPVEFKGSVIIYTSIMSLSRCSTKIRLWCTVALIFYFMYVADGWFGSLFLTGMLLCEIDILAERNELPLFLLKLEPYHEYLVYTLFFASIYLSGVPSHQLDPGPLQKSAGWKWLSLLKPQAAFDYKWFYLWWAGTFLFIVIPQMAWLKGFFETAFCQYLGRISFALYLVHGPVLWIVGDRLYSAVGWHRELHVLAIPGWIDIFPLPKSGPLGLELSFWVPQLIVLPITLWTAELATKFIDNPSVKFSHWLYQKAIENSRE